MMQAWRSVFIKGNIFHKELVLLYKGLYLASFSLNFAFTPFSYKIRFMAKKLQFEVLMAQIDLYFIRYSKTSQGDRLFSFLRQGSCRLSGCVCRIFGHPHCGSVLWNWVRPSVCPCLSDAIWLNTFSWYCAWS